MFRVHVNTCCVGLPCDTSRQYGFRKDACSTKYRIGDHLAITNSSLSLRLYTFHLDAADGTVIWYAYREESRACTSISAFKHSRASYNLSALNSFSNKYNIISSGHTSVCSLCYPTCSLCCHSLHQLSCVLLYC